MASSHSSLSHSSLFAILTCFQWIATLLVCVLLLGRVGAQDRRNEVQALLELIDGATIFSSEARLLEAYWETWNETAENPCAWIGVVCSSNFTVVELDFSGWNFAPDSLQPLAGLRDLRDLDLSSSISSLLPVGIGSLTGLTRLDLSFNQFYGEIPAASISKCTGLKYLNLEQNQFSGEISGLRELVNLQILNLADNQFTGQFPEDLLELSSLVTIDLSGNQLNGSIPSLSKLTTLYDLILDGNNFTKFEESWLPPPNLKTLHVSGNLLSGMIPPSLTNVTTLGVVNMSRNQLSIVPSGFSKFLSRSALTEDGVVLDLSQNQLSGNVLQNILPDLSMLWPINVNLSRNNLSGMIPVDGAKKLFYSSLDLSYNQLSGIIPDFFSNYETNIGSLRLQDNNLSGDITDAFNGITGNFGLSELRLENNLLSGDLSRIIPVRGRCSGDNVFFHVVDLSNNNLQMSTSETNPDPLRALLECFMQFDSLQEVRIAGNNFSGISLPLELNNTFPAGFFFTVLDLSNNHLIGEIYGNAFAGKLWPALQYLNLSNNDLSGPVPENIFNFTNLEVFDVANNSLSGLLPAIRPDSALYNPTFFQGNDGLCGDPLPACFQPDNWLVLFGSWLNKEKVYIIIGGLAILGIGSCLFALWQWKVYNKRHQQDADLIRTLLERESITLMTLGDLKKATCNFAESAQIGEGGFGVVFVGKLTDGRQVAIKKGKPKGSDKIQFLNEVRILSLINHRHLVKLLGCCMENQIALLVFEFISNGTLQEHLQGKFGAVCLSWDKRVNIAIQTAEALNYLHSGAAFPIYHRDVKSANILLDEHFHAKLADLGISRLAPIEATHVSTIAIKGTMGYIDPDYYTSYQLNDKSDIYSFGVVLLELISAKPAIDPLRGGDETSLVNFAKPYIQSGDLQQFVDGNLLQTYDDPTGDGKESILSLGRLALKCLQMQSKARPSMKDVLKELQDLSIELNGQSKDSGSTNELHNQDSQYEHIMSFVNISSTISSSYILQNGGMGIEMNQSSCLRV